MHFCGMCSVRSSFGFSLHRCSYVWGALSRLLHTWWLSALVSAGVQAIKIPVFNEVDNELAPTNIFTYIK